MELHSKTAATTGIVDGGVVKNVARLSSYTPHPEIATSEYAAIKLATRFQMTLSMARLICELAQIGGRVG